MTDKQHQKWMTRHFPTAVACQKADEAIDQLGEHEPMSRYIDTWIREYIRAGGVTPLKFWLRGYGLTVVARWGTISSMVQPSWNH